MPMLVRFSTSFAVAFLTGCETVSPEKLDVSAEHTAIVPILMYHHVQELPPDADEVMRTWTVSTKDFTAQMKFLHNHGYHAISLEQLANHLTGSSTLPNKPIIITFDDGWEVGYSTILPILADQHLSGTFFVCPSSIGDNPGNGYVTWPQLREMVDAGMDVQAHTLNHPHLGTIPVEAQRRELVESKRILEEKLGRPIIAVAYPFGQFNARVMKVTQEAGYRCAVTIEPGLRQRESELFSLHRIRISYGDTLDTFREQISWP